MDEEKARAGLKQVAEAARQRSLTKRLGTVFSDVEAALRAGATHAEVLSALAGAGLVMSPAGFATSLRRLRSRARASTGHDAPAAASSATRVQPPAPSPAPEPVADSPQPAAADQSISDIRNTDHDLAAMRRQWRKIQREEANKSSPKSG